jgi:hypothetical protein
MDELLNQQGPASGHMGDGAGTYVARDGQVAYGYTIGMICAEWHIPFIPGDLNNATTFPFPVRYISVPGAKGAAVLAGETGSMAQPFIDAARRLEAEGVRAITSNCGFLAPLQPIVSSSVDVPVFLSSLVQAPLLATMLGSARKVGVLLANSSSINDDVLKSVGMTEPGRLVFQGLEGGRHWNECILQELGVLDEARIREEVVAAAVDMVRRDGSIGAILMECSDLPPYSKAVADATGRPVFDWANFIEFVHRATNPRTYAGLY